MSEATPSPEQVSASRVSDASARLLRSKHIFLSVRELPLEERENIVDRECGDDVQLRELVLQLLAGESMPLPVETLAEDIRAAHDAAFESPHLEPQGSTIDRYRLVERIGEGGFGVVFAAEQIHPVKRRVALKLIKLGMDTRQVIARFEAERQALAMMEHPSIAKVLDAGATKTGRPYFVMELVKGLPITEYCDAHTLDIRARLALFMQVCDAVQHAHNKGIIHRDLKPSNVLITETGTNALPKIIDFGIAKATSGSLSDKTVYTQMRQMIGTPEYMSPEQASVSSTDIDTRADVYSLGVILYELLTGVTPFDGKRLRTANYGEVQRIISEENPPRPSVRFTKQARSSASVAANRRSDARELTTSLRGELDWIAMKAMEKDRERRYDSASSLAMDIARYLSHQAVLAAPPSTIYQARKFVRRNWVMVAAASITAAALLIGSIGFAWQAHQARQQRDAAIESQARAETTMDFLLSVLRKGDPASGVGSDSVTVEQAMQAAISDLKAGRFSNDPETESKLWTAIADTLQWYTRENQAVELYQSALDSIQRKYPEDHPAVAAATSRLAYFRYAQREYDVASEHAQNAVAMLERLKMNDTPEMIDAINTRLIVSPPAQPNECVAEFRRMYEMQQRLRPGDSEDTISMMWNLGNTLMRQEQYEEGDRLLSEALAMSRRLYPHGSITVSHAMSFLGIGKRLQRKYAEAEHLAHESIELYQRFVKQETLESTGKLKDLADAQLLLGKADDSEATCNQALGYLLTREHPRTAAVLSLRARSRQALGRFAEARGDFDASLSLMRRVAKDRDSALFVDLLYQSALTRLDRAERNEALSELREAYEVAQKARPLDQQLVGRISTALKNAELPSKQ